MKHTTIALAIALSAGRLGAALGYEKVDHLEPHWSAPGASLNERRMLVIHTVFHDAWNPEILLRMHGDDGALGQEEYVITLEVQNGKYSVVNFHTPHRLFAYWYPPPPPLHIGSKEIPPTDPTPKNYRDIKPARCETAIAPELAKRIIAAWHSVLMETRYYDVEPMPPIDGGWYEFSMEHNQQTLAGAISDSAQVGSKPERVIGIAMEMRMFCLDQPAKARALLEADLSSFEKQYGSR